MINQYHLQGKQKQNTGFKQLAMRDSEENKKKEIEKEKERKRERERGK